MWSSTRSIEVAAEASADEIAAVRTLAEAVADELREQVPMDELFEK